MLMVMFTSASGYQVKHMDMVFTSTQTGLSIKVIGLKINSMVMELKHGQVVIFMKGSTEKGRKMVSENLNGQMDLI